MGSDRENSFQLEPISRISVAICTNVKLQDEHVQLIQRPNILLRFAVCLSDKKIGSQLEIEG